MNYLLVNKHDINTSMYHVKISELQSYELTDGIDKQWLDAYGTLPIFPEGGKDCVLMWHVRNICSQ